MRRLTLLVFLSMITFVAPAKAGPFNACAQSECCFANWYGFVGAGYAFSLKAGIKNPDPAFWDFAFEGYDRHLESAPFFFIGFGKKWCCLDFDISYSYYRPFHYKKFQTGVSATPGFTGPSRTRFFDLEHENILFTATFDPKWRYLCYRFCGLQVNPLLGIGIGAGIHHVNNFHTVGFSPTALVGSTTSIGKRVTTTSFAWQALAALRFQFGCSPLSLDIGYRYYDGGRFFGPGTVVSNTPTGLGAKQSGKPWRGTLRANEIYLDLMFNF